MLPSTDRTASVEAQNLSFVQHSLRPLLERLEQSFSNLLPEPDGFIKFNLDALLRGTTIERYDAYTKGLREGFLSLNDVRSVEDLAPIGEAGDQFRVPLQNIDASDAKDVGLNLRADIVSKLVIVWCVVFVHCASGWLLITCQSNVLCNDTWVVPHIFMPHMLHLRFQYLNLLFCASV